MPHLNEVEQIILQPSGLIFIYDQDGNLLATPCNTTEIRRTYNPSLGWTFQFTGSDGLIYTFDANYITLIQASPTVFQTYTDLGPTPDPITLLYTKFNEVYAYLGEFVFLCCCEDPGPYPWPYPTGTWAEWLAVLNADLLPKGQWIEVTSIPSQPGAIFSMFCTELNQIALGGFGQFQNADWQNVGDYSGVLALTSVTPLVNVGQWYAELEYLTIDYSALAGGTFSVSDTITDTVTGAVGTVISDDGVSQMVIQITANGFTFFTTDGIDNGTGVTATIDTLTSSIVNANGNIVIYNGLNYQVTDSIAVDGTDPATNTLAYTELPKEAGMGYINEVDEIEFDFVPDWLQYRADKRGNRYAYSQKTDTNDFALGFTAINQFQWGRDSNFAIVVSQSRFDNLNILGTIGRVDISNLSAFYGNTFDPAGVIIGMTLSGGAYFINNSVNASMSAIVSHAAGFNLCTINQQVTQFDLSTASLLENKTFDALCSGWNVCVNMTFTETISSSINSLSHQSGLSNQPREFDITGLTTIDIGTNAELVGIYNLTSGNATETINIIDNPPTLFPFTLKPVPGLVVTITFTPFASLSASGEIVGASASIVLDGDRGDFLTLEVGTLSGFSISRQINASTIA